MAEAPKKKYLRWILLFGVCGIVDIVQVLIDLTGVGIAVSEILEVAMPFVIGGILLIFRILNIQTGLSIGVAMVADAATGGAAPFWIGDAWYIYRKVRKQEAAELEEEEQSEENQQLVQNGRRRPSGRPNRPANEGGVRLPNNDQPFEEDGPDTGGGTEEQAEDDEETGEEQDEGSDSFSYTDKDASTTETATYEFGEPVRQTGSTQGQRPTGSRSNSHDSSGLEDTSAGSFIPGTNKNGISDWHAQQNEAVLKSIESGAEEVGGAVAAAL
jgi:hypothetical protein